MNWTVSAALAAAMMMMPAAALAQPASAIELWKQGKPAFGVYAPNENAASRGPGGGRGEQRPALYTREGGERLAANPLYDYVFLNLEGSYDPAAVKAMADGIKGRKTLIVRIPPIDKDGAAAARARVKEALANGADGVTIPHVQNIDQARQAIGFFTEAGANVWSPTNPGGTKIAMLMLEDPEAVKQAGAIADLKGISILACGIGSLTQALGGDRAGAEAATQQILAETKRVKIADMLTANASDVEKRVREGFLALLMQGSAADEAIRIGRAAAGR